MSIDRVDVLEEDRTSRQRKEESLEKISTGRVDVLEETQRMIMQVDKAWLYVGED